MAQGKEMGNMATVVCTARVRKDGSLTIPRAIRKELGLKQGDTVQVLVQRSATSRRTRTKGPLSELVGIGKGGPPDGAKNHDKYLYGKRSA
jgi:AbrB family looped-hinge helix DNA binding protein